MTLIIADRVKETTTTTGTGALTLAGAMIAFRAFSSVCAVNDTCYYCIQAVDGSGTPTGDWEVGLGTYSATNTLTRTTVLSSSNSGSAVNFAAGTKQVWLDLTASDYITTRSNALAGASGYSQVVAGTQSVISSASPLILTGLDTANYDYKLAIRLLRSSGGSTSDYIQIQFGDTTTPTPNWSTNTLFTSVTGAATGNLGTSGGVTKIAQVQNNSTLVMGSTIELSFTNGTDYAVCGFAKSCMWENTVLVDGQTAARCGALKLTTVNQNWSADYTLWKLKRT